MKRWRRTDNDERQTINPRLYVEPGKRGREADRRQRAYSINWSSRTLEPSKNNQKHGDRNQHIAEDSEPVKLPMPGDLGEAALRPVPLFRHEGIAAPGFGVDDVEGPAASPESGIGPSPRQRHCAQQNVTRQDIPRHDAGEEVDVTFHRQKDQHEADSAAHETIPARAKLENQDGGSEQGPGPASAEAVSIHELETPEAGSTFHF